jgi:hypothetical protein
MSNDTVDFGKPGKITPVEPKCGMDIFENAIREYGVIAACEWFGYHSDSEFTRETIDVLIERSNANQQS